MIEKLNKISPKNKNFFHAIGRRKTAVAQVRFDFKKDQPAGIFINKQTLQQYFPNINLQQIIYTTLKIGLKENDYILTIKVKGGGKKAQAEAIRLGIARLLVQKNKELKTILKSYGLLRRDSRIKERKKFGLKRARKAPQWQKR